MHICYTWPCWASLQLSQSLDERRLQPAGGVKRGQVSLKDLCVEDKQRIANLIKELARLSQFVLFDCITYCKPHQSSCQVCSVWFDSVLSDNYSGKNKEFKIFVCVRLFKFVYLRETDGINKLYFSYVWKEVYYLSLSFQQLLSDNVILYFSYIAGGRNSSVGSAWARCPQRRGFDSPLGTFSGRGDFSLGVNMGSNSIPPKTLSDESLVCAHMHFIAWTQKILTFMS